jgi:hypothetical protein
MAYNSRSRYDPYAHLILLSESDLTVQKLKTEKELSLLLSKKYNNLFVEDYIKWHSELQDKNNAIRSRINAIEKNKENYVVKGGLSGLLGLTKIHPILQEERDRLEEQHTKNRALLYPSFHDEYRKTISQIETLQKLFKKIEKELKGKLIEKNRKERYRQQMIVAEEKAKKELERLQISREKKLKIETERKQKDLEKQKLLKNQAALNKNKIRKIGDMVKRKIVSTKHCPYCVKLMFDGGHADHIYPVSKGGHSIETNMVKVCGDCNMKKSNLTLREFITKFKLDRDTIEQRLDELGKKF